MSKEQAVLRYETAMAVFKRWVRDGLISKEELEQIDTMIAKRYGLSLGSIYRL